MIPRSLRILLTCFMSLWLGIIVPGHQRGIVQLPGSDTGCCKKADTLCKKPGPCAPDDKPASTCAICQFIATIDVPPPVTFVVPPTGFVCDLIIARHQAACLTPSISPITSRGPPFTA